VKVKIGDHVKEGEAVIVLEAMKMFNNLDVKFSGTVKDIKVDVGDSVGKGDVLIIFE
jgi:biotin carboxyl carrier protein